jgi:putative phosphoesterase
MKILVMSDSHKNTLAVLQAVSQAGPDLVLHLGDHDTDCKIIRQNMPQIPIRAVRGNCDMRSNELDVDEFVAEGKRILMTHGHLYGVKATNAALLDEAVARQADIVLYGHTHRPFYMEYEGMYIINPGSIGMGQNTYSVITIDHGAVSHEQYSLDMWR